MPTPVPAPASGLSAVGGWAVASAPALAVGGSALVRLGSEGGASGGLSAETGRDSAATCSLAVDAGVAVGPEAAEPVVAAEPAVAVEPDVVPEPGAAPELGEVFRPGEVSKPGAVSKPGTAAESGAVDPAGDLVPERVDSGWSAVAAGSGPALAGVGLVAAGSGAGVDWSGPVATSDSGGGVGSVGVARGGTGWSGAAPELPSGPLWCGEGARKSGLFSGVSRPFATESTLPGIDHCYGTAFVIRGAYPVRMPRYDYRCRACGDTFEVSRPMRDAAEAATCPQGHADTVKLLSTVAVMGRGGGSPSASMGGVPGGGGGGCCGGACGC
jgi:putative FmdB family regulatory protein